MDTGDSQGQQPQQYTIQNNQLASAAQQRYFASELCQQACQQLQALAANPQYDTDSAIQEQDTCSFVDRHLYYLSMHPNTKLDGYISNLKIMLNKKRRV